MILQNLKNQEYLKLYETLVAGSLFAILGPKVLEIVIYPLANKIIKYEKIDEKSDKIKTKQLLRLLVIVAYVFVFGYALSRSRLLYHAAKHRLDGSA